MNDKKRTQYHPRVYLPNISGQKKFWKTKKLCELFGIDFKVEKASSNLAEEAFFQLAEQYGCRDDAHYLKLAGKAYILRNIGAYVFGDKYSGLSGEILLTHPLKILNERENAILAGAISLVSLKRSYPEDKRENYLESMAAFDLDDDELRIARIIAEAVYLSAGKKDAADLQVAADLNQMKEETTTSKSAVEPSEDSVTDPPESLDNSFVSVNFQKRLTNYITNQISSLKMLTSDHSRFSDPEVIHDIRVIFRKIISVNAIFPNYIKSEWVNEFIPQIRRGLKKLGSLRDLDVLREKIFIFSDPRSDIAESDLYPILSKISEKREKNLKKVLSYFDSEEWVRLTDSLCASLEDGICRPILYKDREASFIDKKQIYIATLTSCFDRVLAYSEWLCGLQMPEPIIHQLRLAFKNFRYTLNFFRNDLNNQGMTLLERCISFQDTLGTLHDNTVLISFLQVLESERKEEGLTENEQRAIDFMIQQAEAQRQEMSKRFQQEWVSYISQERSLRRDILSQ